MPAKEIKALRRAGNMEEALNMAKAELAVDPDNIWCKRNISWVYYEYLKLNSSPELYNSFISWLNEIKNLQLPADEKMLFDHLSWQVGKMAFGLMRITPIDPHRTVHLFEAIESIPFSKPSEGYSFLFKAFHKSLKETDRYIRFADWWDFRNFMPEDLQKERLPNGREVMAIAEQAYITYAKHLLPKQTQFGEVFFDREKALAFLPILSEVVENCPQFQYPAYFNAKLLLALGDNDNILESLLPFARKKKNDFWVWEILAEAFKNDEEKVFACYCRALTCNSPEEMLVSLRQKMAGKLVNRKLYNEARTEIELLVNARNEHGFKIPNEILVWQSQDWYKNAIAQRSNYSFYKKFVESAESILYSDTPEELVIVDFVNADKRMLNFVASEAKFGFFKYERFLQNVSIGDTLKVRFQGGSVGSIYKVLTAVKINDPIFKSQFIKEVSGEIIIPTGKSFGFLGEAFIHPNIINKNQLSNGLRLKARAIKSYNQEKKQWSWKVFDLLKDAVLNE